MIDYDLFTWSDVQSAIQADTASWPDGFYSARAYWDEVVIEHAERARGEVERWLSELFGPRWRSRDGHPELRLKSAPNHPPRTLAVRLEEVTGESAPTGRARRSFTDPDTVMRRERWWTSLSPLSVPVMAFHSFKGGVGRTTAALQLTRLLAQRDGVSVLVVDMDFEAPGITWMVQASRLPSPSIAMSDVLALFHGTASSHRPEIVELVAHELQRATAGPLFILPAVRPHQRSIDVRPEHLESAEGDTLAAILADVAMQLEAQAVVVDLRAGHSELSASLLLDPRVSRALVTTGSGQSIHGTKQTLERLAAAPPDRESDPALTVVLSRLTKSDVSTFQRIQTELIEAADTPTRGQGELRFTANLHDEGLLSLPLAWEDATARLAESSTLDLDEVSIDLTFAQWSDELIPVPVAPVADLEDRRAQLAAFASNLIHAEGSGRAEGSEPGPFLDASFIKQLITVHRRELPKVVAIGAKGAGKTFTFLRMVGHGSWSRFARAAHGAVEIDATIVPVAWPSNLRDSAEAIIDVALADRGDADRLSTALRERRDAAKATNTTSTQWRDWWLDWLAIVAGPASRDPVFDPSASPILFVVDGLEDLLPDIKDDAAEQKCLRALLQEVPAWLKAANAPCGLVVFVRQDYVGSAIPQNAEQFRTAHQAYSLRWDRREALRLVQWTAEQAGVVPRGAERGEALVELWGRKLGRDRSREAITENWVLDAISTRRDQVQARDLVRLIAEAAQRSVGRDDWDDRVLAPQAIRGALETVGHKKIEEILEEEPRLGTALERFRSLGGLQVPFTPADLPTDEHRLALVELESAGIAWREGGEIWLVSLYRRGLGIPLQGSRREKVLR